MGTELAYKRPFREPELDPEPQKKEPEITLIYKQNPTRISIIDGLQATLWKEPNVDSEPLATLGSSHVLDQWQPDNKIPIPYGWSAISYHSEDGVINGYVESKYLIYELPTANVGEKYRVSRLDQLIEAEETDEHKYMLLFKSMDKREREYLLEHQSYYLQQLRRLDFFEHPEEVTSSVISLRFPLRVKLTWLSECGPGLPVRLFLRFIPYTTEEEIDHYFSNENRKLKLKTRKAMRGGRGNTIWKIYTWEKELNERLKLWRKPELVAKKEERKRRKQERKRLTFRTAKERIRGTERLFYLIYEKLPASESAISSAHMGYDPQTRYQDQGYIDLAKAKRDQTKREIQSELAANGFSSQEDYEKKLELFTDHFQEIALSEAFAILLANQIVIKREMGSFASGYSANQIHEAFNEPRKKALETDERYREYLALKRKFGAEDRKVRNAKSVYYESRKDAVAQSKVVKDALVQEYNALSFKNFEDDGDLLKLAKASKSEVMEMVEDSASEVMENIQYLRAALQEDEDQVWSLDVLLKLTKEKLELEDGDVWSMAVDREAANKRDEGSFLNHILSGLVVVVGIAAAPFTGGASLVLSGIALGIDSYLIYQDFKNYQFESAAAGSAFDIANSLAKEHPSKFWLALSIAFTLLELGFLARSVRALAKAPWRRLSQSKNLRAGRKAEFMEEVAEEADKLGLSKEKRAIFIKKMEEKFDRVITKALPKGPQNVGQFNNYLKDTFPKLQRKFDKKLNDIQKQKFFDDFNGEPDLLRRLEDGDELLDAWKTLDNTPLRKNMDVLEGCNNLLKKGIDKADPSKILKIAEETNLLDEVLDLAKSPGFKNPEDLATFMGKIKPEILQGKNGLRNNLNETLRRLRKGHTVALDNGMADVVDYTKKVGIQIKTHSGTSAKSFFKNLKAAAKQLRGETDEVVPNGFKKVAIMDFDNPSHPIYLKTRSELKEILKNTHNGNSGNANFLDGVDEIIIKTESKVETFTPPFN